MEDCHRAIIILMLFVLSGFFFGYITVLAVAGRDIPPALAGGLGTVLGFMLSYIPMRMRVLDGSSRPGGDDQERKV